MKLSILIVNWNTKDLLLNCLASILKFPPKWPYEVIVVDNDSGDGSFEAAKEAFPQFSIMAAGSNLGYAEGNNLAFSVATGEYLLTLNSDTVFEDDSLSLAVEALENEPRYGALGIRQVGVDGATQQSVRGFPTLLGVFGDVTKLGKFAPRSSLASYRLPLFNYDVGQQAPQPMGTFLLFRRKALEWVGDASKPFDELFPIFFNEVDLLYRLAGAGWPTLYSPEPHVVHYGGESTKLVRKSIIWESHLSLIRFWKKHARTQWGKLAIGLAVGPIWIAALIRARGYSHGFRTQRYHL